MNMITTDTGAKKWENSDNWRQIYQAHNDSVDAEDAAIAALQDGLAIVANGNTHAAIAAGQFVFVKNHDTLATGLYTANSAIAANATLTSSNLTADPSGGLNVLNSNLSSIKAETSVYSSLTPNKVAINTAFIQEIGKLVICYLSLTTTAAISAGDDIISGLPRPYGTQNFTSTFLASDAATQNTNTYKMALMDEGKVRALESIPNGIIIRATFVYFKG